ncbi:restriction endonuclease [Enterococcus hirae]
MVFKFLQKFKEANQLESNAQEVVSKQYLEIRKTSFVQKKDEKIVIDFLSDMDKDFGSSQDDRVRQGEHFEQFLAAAFRLAGYGVEITKKSYVKAHRKYVGDGGVDLILTKEKKRIAVQAKSNRLNAKPTPTLIGRKDITNFSGISNKNWDKKMFITTSFFYQQVYEEIEQNEKAKEIEWYDRYGLLQLLNQIIPDTMLKFQLLNSLPMGIKICPKCSEGIIINCRNGKTGHLFKACSLHCGHTEKFNTTE